VQIGLDIALARIILSMIFGILIGLLMAWFFRKDDAAHAEEAANNKLFNEKASIPLPVLIFFLLLLGTLLAGTLQIYSSRCMGGSVTDLVGYTDPKESRIGN